MTPKIAAIHISVPVIDMEATVKFYIDVLGLRISEKSNDLTQLYSGIHLISLRRTRPESESIQRDSNNGIRSRHFGFRMESRADVDCVFSKLSTKGVKVLIGNAERPGVYSLFCADPSGNQVEIYSE